MQEIAETSGTEAPDASGLGDASPETAKSTAKADADERCRRVAFLAKSLSDENRLRILHFISSGKKSVGSIVEGIHLSQPLVSHHLKELKRSLLVTVERSGPFIYYELADPRVLNVVDALEAIAEDLLRARKTF